MGRPANKPEDVWRFIDKRSENECWPWLGTLSVRGYGVFHIKRKTYRVARIVCWLRDPSAIDMHAGPNGPDRKIPLHSCDNPPCCNPGHLSVGTPKQNTQDMIRKGRRANMNGERGGRAKLTHADVERIREARLFGATQKDLASIYGVSGPTISTALSGRYYGCVPVKHHKSNRTFSKDEEFFVRLQKKYGASVEALALLYDVKKATIKDIVSSRRGLSHGA